MQWQRSAAEHAIYDTLSKHKSVAAGQSGDSPSGAGKTVLALQRWLCAFGSTTFPTHRTPAFLVTLEKLETINPFLFPLGIHLPKEAHMVGYLRSGSVLSNSIRQRSPTCILYSSAHVSMQLCPASADHGSS
eukprot:306661-Chlamydomonas_euryale.AAC.2